MARDLIKVVIRLSPAELEQLDEETDKRGMSRAALGRRAIVYYLNHLTPVDEITRVTP